MTSDQPAHGHHELHAVPPARVTRACATFFEHDLAIERFAVFVTTLYGQTVMRDRSILVQLAKAEELVASLEDNPAASLQSAATHRAAAKARHPLTNEYDANQNTLAQMIFSRSVDNFIPYFRDLLRLIFEIRPEVLRSAAHTETHEFILQYPNMDELVSAIIDKRMDVIDHSGMKEFREYFARIGLELFQADTERTVNRLTERRNLIVHNRGLVNARYLRMVGHDAGSVGTPLALDLFPMMRELQFLAKYVADFDVRATSKFGLPTEAAGTREAEPNIADERISSEESPQEGP